MLLLLFAVYCLDIQSKMWECWCFIISTLRKPFNEQHAHCTYVTLFKAPKIHCNVILRVNGMYRSTLKVLIFSHSERTVIGKDLLWDSLFILTALKSVKTGRQRSEADVTVQESPAVCSASPSKDLSAKKFGWTMRVDRAWNYYHHQFWMKKRKHIIHKKEAHSNSAALLGQREPSLRWLVPLQKNLLSAVETSPFCVLTQGFLSPKEESYV